MTKEQRFRFLIDYFTHHKPDAKTELIYSNAYELLVAVILSAQCTDKRVNITTPFFFETFPTVEVLAATTPEVVFPLIKSISYPNNKSRHLVAMAQMVTTQFDGKIPSEIDLLLQLPGVGRKTANVIASVIFNKPTMAVDTHVFRVTARIGLTTNAKSPLATENQLIKYIPKKIIPLAHHWLILHGRYVCIARTPKCFKCGLQSICKFFMLKKNQTLREGKRKREQKRILGNNVS